LYIKHSLKYGILGGNGIGEKGICHLQDRYRPLLYLRGNRYTTNTNESVAYRESICKENASFCEYIKLL